MRYLKRSLFYAIPAVALLAYGAGTGDVAAFKFGSSAQAAEAAAKDAKKPTVSAKVGKPLKEAQDLVAKNAFKEALAKLQEAQAIAKRTPYEDYAINELLMFVSFKLNDMPSTVRAGEAGLNSGFLAPADVNGRLKQLAQLHASLKNYPKAIAFTQRYIEAVGSDAEMSYLLAQIYYFQNDFKNAAANAKTAVQVAERAGQKPKEEWLQVLMSSYYELKQDALVVATQEQMVKYYPKPAYWRDLLGNLQGQAGLSDRQNLAIYRLKFRNSALEDADEYMEMAELSMSLGLPGEAKTILEAGFTKGLLGKGANKDRETRLLAEARKQAAEDVKTLPSDDKAAQAIKTGEADVKVGEAFATYGQYDPAIVAIKRGIAKGGVKSPDDAQLLLGITFTQANRGSEAVAALKSVPKESKVAAIARLWAIEAQ